MFGNILELLRRLLVLSVFMKLLYAMYLKYRDWKILERTNLYNVRKINRIFIAIGIAKFIYAMYLKHKQN